MSGPPADPLKRPEIIDSLHRVLLDLAAHPFPILESPPKVRKRASVALILRINPQYSHWPGRAGVDTIEKLLSPDSASGRLNDFFNQDWVQWGEPEALFIKRSARQGDRWQGHVALPGGRRDPEDEDDRAAAVRESKEEVGIDLSSEHAIAVSNLPQRLVTTSWGKVPLMVLCPYVFLLQRHDVTQKLQPTEIASTHWVPLRGLLSPALRTVEYQDVSSRLAKQEFGIKRWFLRLMLGQMMFSAIRLVPSETMLCSSVPGFLPGGSQKSSGYMQRFGGLLGIRAEDKARKREPPLLLWGLTLGVLADFLDLLPPHDALELWTYPTFSPPDVRFVLWVMSYTFRKQKAIFIRSGKMHAPASARQDLDAITVPSDLQDQPEGTISGLGVGSRAMLSSRDSSRYESGVGTMLEGYYEIVRKGVTVMLMARTTVFLLALLAVWRRRRRR